VNLITAAGSLDYGDLSRHFPEAVRVLVPGGVLLVCDFSQGRSLRGSPRLDTWVSQTNVAHAVQRGVQEQSIRSWCAETLTRVSHLKGGLVKFCSGAASRAWSKTKRRHSVVSRRGLVLPDIRFPEQSR